MTPDVVGDARAARAPPARRRDRRDRARLLLRPLAARAAAATRSRGSSSSRTRSASRSSATSATPTTTRARSCAKAARAELGCVIHCFTGTPDDARGVRRARLLRVVLAASSPTRRRSRSATRCPWCPRDRLLIETDCPYLAPIPMRGKRNEPAFVVHTAEVVARVRRHEFRGVSARSRPQNACRVFRLPSG